MTMSAAMEVEKDNVEAGASSVDSKVAAAPARKKGVSADDNREAFSPELLRIYYARLFPYEQVRCPWVAVYSWSDRVFTWLCVADVCFTL